MGITIDFQHFGKRLRERRKKRKLTQLQLAAAADLSSTHISNIERGQNTISVDSLIRICNALEITPNELLCDSFTESRQVLIEDISVVLADCSGKELRSLSRFLRYMKQYLREEEKMISQKASDPWI